MAPMRKPNFQAMLNSFSEVNTTVKSVGDKIGGKVKINIDIGVFTNACPIRMSYALNQNGFLISHVINEIVSGSDHKWYYMRVVDLKQKLMQLFGKPDVQGTKANVFSGQRGIIFFDVQGWGNATGHVTLWNQNTCADHCYFDFPPDEVKKGVKLVGAGLWTLP